MICEGKGLDRMTRGRGIQRIQLRGNEGMALPFQGGQQPSATGNGTVKVLDFESVSPAFEMERSGEKPFTVWKIDFEDDRYKTILDRLEHHTLRDDLIINTVNPATGDSFHRRLVGAEIIADCPMWMILRLGHAVDDGVVEVWRETEHSVVSRLPPKVVRRLKGAYQRGVITKPLTELSDEELYIIPGIGPMSIHIIREAFPRQEGTSPAGGEADGRRVG